MCWLFLSIESEARHLIGARKPSSQLEREREDWEGLPYAFVLSKISAATEQAEADMFEAIIANRFANFVKADREGTENERFRLVVHSTEGKNIACDRKR